ncbi:MAG TPA: FAD-dependent thymidylate synthase, partial [Candidatus Paceibacterota bacterium]
MDTSTSNPYIKKAEDGRLVITQEGEEFLKRIVTDPKGQVYVFTNEAPPLIVAAAMARLSRRGDDLRTIYLDEFAAVGEEHAEDLMDRVITAYGDDSVQQLGVLSFVVEEASNLLTKVLEWGRLMSYLEQSTRYIFYDTLDADGRHKYFTPNIKSPFSEHYREAMDSIFGLYSEVVRGVTAYVRQKFPEPADPRERTAWLGATRAQACDAARP